MYDYGVEFCSMFELVGNLNQIRCNFEANVDDLIAKGRLFGSLPLVFVKSIGARLHIRP